MKFYLGLLLFALTISPVFAQTLKSRNDNGQWYNGYDRRDRGSNSISDAQKDLANKNSIYNPRRSHESSEKSLMSPSSRGDYFRKSSDRFSK